MHAKVLQIVAGTCLILSAGVFVNILLLQDQRRPIIEAQAPQQLIRVRAVQRELAERKYYGGQLDGNLSIHTRAAIMDYEAAHHQSITGEASDALLKTILLGSSLEVVPVNVDIAPQAQQVIQHVQILLNRVGFRKIASSGQLDDTTIIAIREFELNHRLPPKGRISYDLVRQLERVLETNNAQRTAAAKQ